MALTREDKEDIVRLCVETVQQVQPEPHKCGLCEQDPEAARELQHIIGVIRDIGKGDLREGVEHLRRNSNFVIALRDSVKLTRVEIVKMGTKCFAVAVGAGLVLLFGDKMWAAIQAAKAAGPQ